MTEATAMDLREKSARVIDDEAADFAGRVSADYEMGPEMAYRVQNCFAKADAILALIPPLPQADAGWPERDSDIAKVESARAFSSLTGLDKLDPGVFDRLLAIARSGEGETPIPPAVADGGYAHPLEATRGSAPASPTGPTDIDAAFAGYGVALRQEGEPPIPGEPLMSMADAKRITRDLIRQALASPAPLLEGEK